MQHFKTCTGGSYGNHREVAWDSGDCPVCELQGAMRSNDEDVMAYIDRITDDENQDLRQLQHEVKKLKRQMRHIVGRHTSPTTRLSLPHVRFHVSWPRTREIARENVQRAKINQPFQL